MVFAEREVNTYVTLTFRITNGVIQVVRDPTSFTFATGLIFHCKESWLRQGH